MSIKKKNTTDIYYLTSSKEKMSKSHDIRIKCMIPNSAIAQQKKRRAHSFPIGIYPFTEQIENKCF